MAERLLHRLPEPELELALRNLGPSIAWPNAEGLPGEPDLATTVRARIEATPAPRPSRPVPGLPAHGFGWPWRPARRAMILAFVALLALAALAGAVGLGLPGLRLIFGEAPVSPPLSPAPTIEPGRPTPAGLGASIGLGDPLDPTDAAGLTARAGFPVALPTDPAVGSPGAAYIDDERGGQVTFLWPAGPELPATLEPGVGLLLGEFQGAVNDGFFVKVIGNGTTLERVHVGGHQGYWISGQPHVLFWDGPAGPVDDSRRWVGDALIWSDGPITFRMESALGRDAAIRVAESLP